MRARRKSLVQHNRPEVPEPGRTHVVRPIQLAFGIDEKRPDQPGLVHILACLFPSLEGHDERLDLELFQLLARVLQLQQVSAARQSEQMPMEHQEKPPPAVILEAMLTIVGVPQRERHRGSADTPCHVPDPWQAGRAGGRLYFLTNFCSPGLTVSATKMSPFGAIVM